MRYGCANAEKLFVFEDFERKSRMPMDLHKKYLLLYVMVP